MVEAPAQQPTWMAEGIEKRGQVKNMFASLADRYDLLNSLICFRLHYRWRAIAAAKLELQPDDTVLDLCCGTGSFSRALKGWVGTGGRIMGFDFCLPMLKIAQDHRTDPSHYSLGDALALPLASRSMDGVTVGWGIRNVVDVDAAHREIFRVLKSSKRFVSVDMAQPRNPLIRNVSGRVFATAVPALAALFGKGDAYVYLPKSTERFKSREELVTSMEGAGFVQVACQDLMFGNICIHWGEKP